ncbi:MAG: 23S rRNA (adenine1618-N6)-methyltransferase [Paraglaciecola sp.]|jgi:23S rRNA (adenine1618-N6)-methyltransferase
MEALVSSSAQLQPFLIPAKSGNSSINFADPGAVKALNAALLAHYYGITVWDIPAGYLCPPVPGRADYIHGIADLLAADNTGHIPRGKKVVALDIGVGANAIYPIIGSQSYGWKFVGSDVDPVAVKSATMLARANVNLQPLLKVRQQTQLGSIFAGIITPQDNFSFTMCNPPFHRSAQEAAQGSQRKVSNLARHTKKRNPQRQSKQEQAKLNFAGTHNELWCEGGELGFINKMIAQSVDYAHQVGWFTSLVSKKENLPLIAKCFAQLGITHTKTIDMYQGQKHSRFIAWTFN